MLKRILAVLLASVAVLTFSACKKDEVDTPVNSDQPVQSDDVVEQPDETKTDLPDDEEETDYEDGLSTERYDGYNFRILLRKNQAKDQYMEEDSEDPIQSAIYKRNKLIEEKYGITITASESSGNYETDALNSILAGDDAYDLVFTHSRAAFTYAVQGAAYNIHDIEAIHLDKPWWSKNLNENCTVNGHLYVLDGDISTQGLGQAMALYFNKRIFDELGFDYPYDSVKEGTWTFDEFAYLAKKGSADLNGDGVLKAEEDQFGFVCYEWDAPINVLYAGGEKIYDKNEEGVLELTLYSNKTVDIFDEFFGLMDNEACQLLFQEGSEKYTGTSPFTDGRAMISTGGLSSAASNRNMDDDFGIVPYPKFDEDDEYATAINGVAHLIIIPITVPDVERTGAIAEALASYSARDVIPAFYDVSLKTKHTRDEESEEMMDIIKDSLIYDLGYVSGGTFQSIGRDLARSTTHDFASTYAASESAALKKLENFNKDYGHVAE